MNIELPPVPIALTIGTFDGVHLGHQALLKRLHNTGLFTVVASFNLPPSSFFSKQQPCLLSTLKLKRLLLSQFGINYLLPISFTNDIAQMSYIQFIDLFLTKVPHIHLILGEGDAFGKEREGDAVRLQTLSQHRPLIVEYIPKIPPVSSTAIRNAIVSGNLPKAAALLGRPYIIIPGELDLLHARGPFCLPPDGTYPVRIWNKTKMTNGLLVIKNRTFLPPFDPCLISFDPQIEETLCQTYLAAL